MTIEQWEELEAMGLARKIPLKRDQIAGKTNLFVKSDGMENNQYFRYEKVDDFDKELDTKVKLQAYEYYCSGKTFFKFFVWMSVISLIIAFCITIGVISSSKSQKNRYAEIPQEPASITEVI